MSNFRWSVTGHPWYPGFRARGAAFLDEVGGSTSTVPERTGLDVREGAAT